ncbi:nuclear transport factor 2 family protein [Pseudogemmobacter humi]|uniref:DUF4440 domain-containing protein n=1 Tax=Pseudogemmobacter humi TaxID=2483812 RepID=A0A3P5XAQ0_9RHOB|nr:nuclear transport factor 2 family protein [Pseudogemmobacter humi]VDC31688.1 hypothetical protein XINFAN_03060 [Pseudogemmobacter humi]
MTEADIRALFARYEQIFNDALAGRIDAGAAATLYAAEFIAASPAGVMAGKNDAQLREVMEQGHARYRAMGTKAMRVRELRLTPLDAHHAVAHVGWRGTWTAPAPAESGEVTIDFEVHYFVQQADGPPRVFGWVSGDEEALLHEHGLI